MEIGLKTQNDTARTALKGAAVGTVIAGAAGAASKAKSKVTPIYNGSLERQQGIIDTFKKTGKTAEKYLSDKKAQIDMIADPHTFCGKVKNLETGKAKVKDAKATCEKMFNGYKNTVKTGTDGALSNLAYEEKVIQKGAPSKLTAINDTTEEISSRFGKKLVSLENKAVSAKAKVKSFFTEKGKTKKISDFVSTKLKNAKKSLTDKTSKVKSSVNPKNKGEFLTSLKDKIVPALKKSAKVLAPIAACTGLALGIKAISDKKKAERESF
ncbi:MAG: hypothetical protein LUE64_03405 [Candidatus Gastranaerophilales bacterium]|nr:hypothetical protein [Candidatus Gastranaerophilales bacterium]